MQFSTTRRKTRLLRPFVTAAATSRCARREPTIYRNRKIANKGSLALCSARFLFSRSIKGGKAAERGEVSSEDLAFSRDTKFISSK